MSVSLPWRYAIAWLGMVPIAVANGALRDFAYTVHLGDLAAHQLSTAILIAAFAAYFFWLSRRWPLRSAGQAWAIGALWPWAMYRLGRRG